MRSHRAVVLLLTAGLLTGCGGGGSPGITVEEGWVAAPAPGMTMLAAYLRIENHGADDRLLGADSPLADAVEIHETVRDGETLRMVQRDDGVAIPAGSTLNLEPGGSHLMVFGVTSELQPGTSFPLSLHFESAGTVEASLTVRER